MRAGGGQRHARKRFAELPNTCASVSDGRRLETVLCGGSETQVEEVDVRRADERRDGAETQVALQVDGARGV